MMTLGMMGDCQMVLGHENLSPPSDDDDDDDDENDESLPPSDDDEGDSVDDQAVDSSDNDDEVGRLSNGGGLPESSGDDDDDYESPPSDDDVVEEPHLVTELAQWHNECVVSMNSTTKLLKVLRRHAVDVPADARTLLSTPKEGAAIVNLGGGQYKYWGLVEGIRAILQNNPDLWPVMIKIVCTAIWMG
jgi:hypothetical protein